MLQQPAAFSENLLNGLLSPARLFAALIDIKFEDEDVYRTQCLKLGAERRRKTQLAMKKNANKKKKKRKVESAEMLLNVVSQKKRKRERRKERKRNK